MAAEKRRVKKVHFSGKVRDLKNFTKFIRLTWNKDKRIADVPIISVR